MVTVGMEEQQSSVEFPQTSGEPTKSPFRKSELAAEALKEAELRRSAQSQRGEAAAEGVGFPPHRSFRASALHHHHLLLDAPLAHCHRQTTWSPSLQPT